MIDKLAYELMHNIEDLFAKTQENEALSSSKLKTLIEAQLRRLNLVTREEFDAQQSVLVRTRVKLEQIEKQVATLEEQISILSSD